MPGERLTYEDRRTIAAGLAGGLGYTEIARRLSRPTSTVSREVARNGGPSDYRADRAHRATAWRAHRRTPRPAGEAPATGEFEADLAAMMVRTGLAAAPARVLASLYTSDTGSYTAVELVGRLRISAASVSKAVRYLEHLRMIRREREGRRDRYVIDDDASYQAWRNSTRTMAVWATATRRGADVLGADTPAGARLRRTSQFFELMHHDMAQAANHYRRALSPS